MKLSPLRIAVYFGVVVIGAICLELLFNFNPLVVNALPKNSAGTYGTAMAGIEANCDQRHLVTYQQFNNVNSQTITLSAPNPSQRFSCTLDFGFDLTSHFIVTSVEGTTPNYLSYYREAKNPSRIDIYLIRPPGKASAKINVIVY